MASFLGLKTEKIVYRERTAEDSSKVDGLAWRLANCGQVITDFGWKMVKPEELDKPSHPPSPQPRPHPLLGSPSQPPNKLPENPAEGETVIARFLGQTPEKLAYRKPLRGEMTVTHGVAWRTEAGWAISDTGWEMVHGASEPEPSPLPLTEADIPTLKGMKMDILGYRLPDSYLELVDRLINHLEPTPNPTNKEN